MLRQRLLIAASAFSIAAIALTPMTYAREGQPNDDRGHDRHEVQVNDDRGADRLIELQLGDDRGVDVAPQARQGDDNGIDPQPHA